MSFLKHLVSRKSNNPQEISSNHIKRKSGVFNNRPDSIIKNFIIYDLNRKRDSNPYLGANGAKACIPAP